MKVSPISSNNYRLNSYKSNTQNNSAKNNKPSFNGIQREAVEHYITSYEYWKNPEKNKAWLTQTVKEHRKHQRFCVAWHELGFYTVNRMVDWRREPQDYFQSFDTHEIKRYSDAIEELKMQMQPIKFDKFEDACKACEIIEKKTMDATKGEFDEIYNFCF